jgi:glycosyltransferase involved in cell wall biosynthesis
VWFLNEDDKELFISSNLVDSSKVVVIPGEGINTRVFKNSNELKCSEHLSFLYLGRILWDKGIGEFVEAARNIKRGNRKVLFKILGFIDQKNPSAISADVIEGWQREGIIEYLGASEDVKNTILSSSCVVLPSHFREGIPRSLLEAASLEKPVIATDIPGCRDVVDDNTTGYLCQPRNASDLQEKMERMIQLSYEERIRMGKAGRQKIKDQFEISSILKCYQNSIFNLTIGKRLVK